MNLEDIDRLKSVANYAKIHKKKNGEVGTTRDNIYKLIEKGKLPHVKIDGIPFIRT